MNILTYDGVSSDTFGLYVGFAGVENAPARNIESIPIPGRNGALTIDNGYYENIEVVYQCMIRQNFETNISAARAFYLSRKGYKRLSDTANPGEYRLARYVAGLEVTPSQMRQQGAFRLIFDCQPQRFLTSGETATTITSSGSVTNPTRFDAKPIIRVYGTGSFTVGSTTISISQNPGYIDIDSEMLSAYYETANCNSYVTGEFPVFPPGQTGIVLGTGITSVVVTPRWWTL